MTHDYATFRPSPMSSIAAVLVAAAVIFTLADSSPVVGQWLLIAVAGSLAVGLGVVGVRGGYRLSGGLLAVLGVGACVGSLAGLGTDVTQTSSLLAIVPGFLGVFVLTGTLAPIRGTGSRTVVKLGAGGVFVCVLVAGLFQQAGLQVLLATTVGTVVVWDAGEHAIGVGEQLGRWTPTWRGELVHVAGTALVGLAGAASVVFLERFASGGLSLPSFGLVFVAVLLLLAALQW